MKVLTAVGARLALYYAALLVAFIALQRAFPGIRDVVSLARLRSVGGVGELERGGPALADAGGIAFLTLLAMVGALALAAPIAWTYRHTRQIETLDTSILQTIIVLPTAVAGIVLIVQNSLALAFSLAGIVAAVRFRNTLKDTKDAVYIFVAIGLGLAAGVQALSAGFVMSLVYVAVMLALWQLDLGGASQGVARRPGGMLLVEVASGPAVRSAVEGVLDARAKRWKLVRATPGTGDRAILTYFVRLRREASAADLAEAVRHAGPDVTSADFEPIED
ncbi:MAG TPA: DUF4956 domain-containing protein [Gemmatimonadales bacterium]